MSRNEITLQEMFSSVIGELREGGRWGTAHIYQSAVNAFSAFTKWQPMPMRKLSPTVLKRFENFLRQRNCSWNTVSTYIKSDTFGLQPGGGQKAACDMYPGCLSMCIPAHGRIGRRRSKLPTSGCLVRETEMSLQGRDISQHPTENKNFLCTDVYAKRAFLLWTWPICTKGIYKEIPCLIDAGRRDGH